MSSAFPPRGSGVEGRIEAAPTARWGHPWQLGPAWDWKPGNILLGSSGDDAGRRLLGVDDDRHMITIAGSRGGKTRTVIKPNLMRYPGSVIVLDPKGELAASTAKAREKFGAVHVLDPFGVLDAPSASYNPFTDIAGDDEVSVAADAAMLADAMIIAGKGESHWTDGARNLLRGISLFELATGGRLPTIADLRNAINADSLQMEDMLGRMKNCAAFGGAVARTGHAFLGKFHQSEKEFQGIISTAQEQTSSLDDVAAVTTRSDFSMRDLKTGVMSVYLVLPGMRIPTHFRWLRMVIQQALLVMETTKARESALPVLFLLEEFAALRNMRCIETAAGFMAGFGVKLWAVIQDISQLRAEYPQSWETFIGNAGILQAFANSEPATLEYLSKMLGNTLITERNGTHVSTHSLSNGDMGGRESIRHVRLLEPFELREYFARETGRQLILTPGRPPLYMERLQDEEL